MWILLAALLILIPVIIIVVVLDRQYKEMETSALHKLGFSSWNVVNQIDETVIVKSRSTHDKYDEIKFFKDNREKLADAKTIIQTKNAVRKTLQDFLDNNEYQSNIQYGKLKTQINTLMLKARAYRIEVKYITSAGNCLSTKEIVLTQHDIDRFEKDPSLLMGKGEYNKYLKEQQKAVLDSKQHQYYELVNNIIDYANKHRESLIILASRNELDNLIDRLYAGTVNSIKKIKTPDSEEWDLIGNLIRQIKGEVEQIVAKNQKILDYYDSADFSKIKDTCAALMNSQREFNEYINEKVQSISRLFGVRVTRSETVINDENNYIRPYKKSITPFTAEVSATVFASAENKPLEYVVKYFYPLKSQYREQIQKLCHLVEELETLKDARQIIENYKKEYQQYLGDVPQYVMEYDESGFYSRLGFANISEDVLTVAYQFSYTSSGGMAQRSFDVPMTEETITELINILESKLTAGAFVKEQRNLMTKKLRDQIKKRDDFTCCTCGNSTYKEPNLLLEIDHIIPVAKGGCTVESNLQTLCWKCNRAKSDKLPC